MKLPKNLLPILFVIVGWIVLIVLQASDKDLSISVLTHRHTSKSITLENAQKIVGEFTARDNNMGIVGVRLDLSNIPDTNRVSFRLKEKGSAVWYYDNMYRITRLPDTRLYPFGFPIINNSAGKHYVFEVERVENIPQGALKTNDRFPVVNTYYKFYKNEFLGSYENALSFILKKTYSYFSNWTDLKIITVTILVVALVQLILRTPLPVVPLIVTLFIMCFETFVAYKILESRIAVVTLLAIFSLAYMKAASKISYIIGLGFLLVCSVMIFTYQEQVIQKTAIFGFTFLCIGFVQDAFVSVQSDFVRKLKAQRRTRLKRKR